MRVIYNGGKSCVTNNGYISELFDLERSTRQGDPISPLNFVLGLELLLINIRSDPNIRGIIVEKGEIKVTAYADDSTYFLKDKLSKVPRANQWKGHPFYLKVLQTYKKIGFQEPLTITDLYSCTNLVQ